MILTRRTLLAAALAVPVVSAAAFYAAGPATAAKPEIFAPGGKAIRGYDPVAYFTQGKPVEGKPDFTHEWKGATWYFASAANRDRFRQNPERWAPQYGGYCAYGVAQGYAVKIEVDQWSVVGGKLYLNYNRSVQRTWKQDIPGYIRTADKNWPGVLK
ncbi:MAG: YHS domain-containing protein [Rhodospirillaceae bacterium]|nr:YHS domain-containing protein [Rhodospirillaceae bacterium]